MMEKEEDALSLKYYFFLLLLLDLEVEIIIPRIELVPFLRYD